MSEDQHRIDPIAAQNPARTVRAGSPVGADLLTAAASSACGRAGEERSG